MHREQVGLQHALDEAFENRRHVSAPQRENEDEMVGGADRFARAHQIRLERLLAAIAFAQDRIEFQFGKRNERRVMAAGSRAARVGLAQRLAETVRNRIADNDGDPGHDHLPLCTGDRGPLRSRL